MMIHDRTTDAGNTSSKFNPAENQRRMLMNLNLDNTQEQFTKYLHMTQREDTNRGTANKTTLNI